MKLFQIAEDYNGDCRGLLPVVKIIRKGIFPIVQIGIPIILIVLGTIDLGKAVISSDDKEVKAAQSRLIKRCIYAVAIFFVTTIVTVLMSLVSGTAGSDSDGNDTLNKTNEWANCWNTAGR